MLTNNNLFVSKDDLITESTESKGGPWGPWQCFPASLICRKPTQPGEGWQKSREQEGAMWSGPAS